MEVTNISYIYGLSSSENSDLIRYIGYSATPLKRLSTHLAESKSLIYHRHKWIQKELENNNKIVLTILRCVPEKEISKAEIETILLYKACGARLVNGNNGGLGGITPTQEVRERLRITKLGNKWNVGKKHTKEQNKKQSLKLKGKKKSEEHIKNIRLAKEKIKGIPKPNYHDRTLNEKQIIDIFTLYNNGKCVRSVGEILNLPDRTVSNILHTHRYYRDIKDKYNLYKTRKGIHGK